MAHIKGFDKCFLNEWIWEPIGLQSMFKPHGYGSNDQPNEKKQRLSSELAV